MGKMANRQANIQQARKNQHLDLCAEQDVEASDRFTGFANISFIPKAIPEIEEHEIDTRSTFLGKEFSLPLLITGMTGGVEKGTLINDRLAEAAVRFNIPMGIGSQRLALEYSKYEGIFQVKRRHPQLFLLGNLGVAQVLAPDGVQQCVKAVEMVAADALAIHINVLQEALQAEGDRNFKGFVDRLHRITQVLKVPVIVKEVGAGLDVPSAKLLEAAGVLALDVGGRGGTAWGYIEGMRHGEAEALAVAESFRNWGIPTAYSLAALKKAGIRLPLIATGGIRDGLTVAKACALGAQMTGVGLPLMRAALQSQEAITATLNSLAWGLKITMLATGSRTLAELKRQCVWGMPYEMQCKAWVERHD